MAKARRSNEYTDYRRVLKAKGDVSLGAYARAERRRRILIGVAGLSLIVGACVAYYLLRPAPTKPVVPTIPLAVRCVVPTCSWEGVLNVPLGQTEQPQECPKCKQRSCQKLWQCRDCGTQFLPKGVATDLRCPACGSAAVGTAEATADELKDRESP